MKKKILILIVGFLLIGVNLYAVDGDLIVDGKVGVGTTNPIWDFHAYKPSTSIRIRAVFESGREDGNAVFRLKNSTQAWDFSLLGFHQNNIFTIRDVTRDEIRMAVTTSGNIGIGTNDPIEKLDVEGNVEAWGFVTGDITFQKDGKKLWRMFEDEDGLYIESLKTGKVYRFVLQEVERSRSK